MDPTRRRASRGRLAPSRRRGGGAELVRIVAASREAVSKRSIFIERCSVLNFVLRAVAVRASCRFIVSRAGARSSTGGFPRGGILHHHTGSRRQARVNGSVSRSPGPFPQ